ncbi:hypothetical protein BDF14DRAFT_1789056 [Spinellus fusiger]|nr:hypothetical protein BDF14DRAFT_1789056 [Spinellus fusiger]
MTKTIEFKFIDFIIFYCCPATRIASDFFDPQHLDLLTCLPRVAHALLIAPSECASLTSKTSFFPFVSGLLCLSIHACYTENTFFQGHWSLGYTTGRSIDCIFTSPLFVLYYLMPTIEAYLHAPVIVLEQLSSFSEFIPTRPPVHTLKQHRIQYREIHYFYFYFSAYLKHPMVLSPYGCFCLTL